MEKWKLLYVICESVTNARPLTYVSEDASDLASIMPNMFLLDLKEAGLPECRLKQTHFGAWVLFED